MKVHANTRSGTSADAAGRGGRGRSAFSVFRCLGTAGSGTPRSTSSRRKVHPSLVSGESGWPQALRVTLTSKAIRHYAPIHSIVAIGGVSMHLIDTEVLDLTRQLSPAINVLAVVIGLLLWLLGVHGHRFWLAVSV